MTDAGTELPAGRQLVTTWWIPDQYAGQTTATLHRVGEQVRRSGRPVDLLTFSALHDNQRKIRQLRDRGALPEGVTLRNLFEDLRRWETDGVLHQRLATRPDVPPAADRGAPVASSEQGEYAIRHYDAHGELVYSEMYRDDRTVLCRDYPVEVDGVKRRYQQFFLPDGSPGKLCGSTWDAYYLWLDHLIGDEPAVIVNESKSTARFLSRYPNPLATLVHVFHESHLADPTNPYKGELSTAHRRIIPHLDRFDAVVFLTRRQRRDVRERFGGGANLHTVPNAGPPAAVIRTGPLDSARRGDRGVVVATWKPLKRIEHAIAAVAEVRRRGASRVSLDVFGRDAGSGESLRAAIAASGAEGVVRLRGYTPGAAEEFRHASFSLMTSITEGQSLVLLESMAGGCVPIAYDIRYGPEELIVDTETGFLVPAGDVEALTETISAFLRLPGRRLRRLRRQCQERLRAFSDEEVYRRWLAVQQAAVAGHDRRVQLADMAVRSFRFEAAGPAIAFQAEVAVRWDTSGWLAADPLPPPAASLLITGRNSGAPCRLPVDLEDRGGLLALHAVVDPAGLGLKEAVGDMHVEIERGASARRQRLRGPAEVRVPAAEVYATGFGNVSLRRR